MLAFLLVILIQLIGMFIHCMETLEQILIHVDLQEESSKKDEWMTKVKPLGKKRILYYGYGEPLNTALIYWYGRQY